MSTGRRRPSWRCTGDTLLRDPPAARGPAPASAIWFSGPGYLTAGSFNDRKNSVKLAQEWDGLLAALRPFRRQRTGRGASPPWHPLAPPRAYRGLGGALRTPPRHGWCL